MPRYGSVSPRWVHADFAMECGSRWVRNAFTVAIDQVEREGVRYLFVDCPPLYARAGIYSDDGGAAYIDNHIRFALLNQAALEIGRSIFSARHFPCARLAGRAAGSVSAREPWRPIPTSPAPKPSSRFTTWDIRATFLRPLLSDLGLSPALFHPGGLEFWGELSFLKAGIVWSDAITTVSPTYAREIQTPEYGAGLDGVLRDRAGKSAASSTVWTMRSGVPPTTH